MGRVEVTASTRHDTGTCAQRVPARPLRNALRPGRGAGGEGGSPQGEGLGRPDRDEDGNEGDDSEGDVVHVVVVGDSRGGMHQ